MATTATPSAWKGHSHSHSQSHSSTRSRPLTTPRSNLTVATPSTQIRSQFSPNANPKSPQTIKDAKSGSPSYFGFRVGDDSIPGDSGPGMHARQNWENSGKQTSRSVNQTERQDSYESFRRQSERNVSFSLNGLPSTRTSSTSLQQSIESPVSPTNISTSNAPGQGSNTSKFSGSDNPFFANVQRSDSPISISPRDNVADARDARLSLPAHELQKPLEALRAQRSDTLPPTATKEVHAMVAPQEIVRLLDQESDKVIVLDLRVSPQYTASRVRGALNLCIPTTLLKRPAFTVQKLADTFTSDADKTKFNRWRTAAYLVVYDSSSTQPKEAIMPFTVLKKFNTEGWKGAGYVIKGGFAGIQKLAPQLVDSASKSNMHPSGPLNPTTKDGQPQLPVAGGCQMPATKNAANPFFGNIRQNMDLLDGVGQIPLKKPAGTSDSEEKRLPKWLRRAASSSNEGKDVSDKFLNIEKREQRTMQKALSGKVHYGSTPGLEKSSAEIQVAGIEKGSKNRYNNIFPYEHTRVRLQNVPSHGCDYVNASYVKATYSNRRYIATQAPIPQTFDDFWRVVWEQDARLIVMLTAESEGGQVKSHAYWKSGEYGQVKVKQTAEQKVSLSGKSVSSSNSSAGRPTMIRRQTTSAATPAVEKKFNFEPQDIKASRKPPEEEPMVIIRRFTIASSSQPNRAPREITQIQYTQWPDFGAPASPTAILSVIRLVDKFQRESSSPSTVNSPSQPVGEKQKPIIVHCSAGCGRTGTFCTIDSVIDMLKRQRIEARRGDNDMDIDSEDDWVARDDIDLIAKAVEDFRGQRLSMVQNLRQFVLCYESVLQWLHDENTK